MRILGVAITVVSVLWTGDARAQGVYVGGAIGAEVVRTSSTRSGGTTFNTGSGEALAGAIRVGAGIIDRVGVELEFFRPGEIEGDLGGPIYWAASSVPVVTSPVPPRSDADSIFPSILGQSTRVRATTTSALLVARQPLGGRVELAYLGGVGFSRVVRETEFNIPRGLLPAAPVIRLPSTRSTQYAAGPVVGVEVRAGMTEHAQVVAGLRLHTLGQGVVDGWMIRPSVGLAWKF
jgi:hypothetical protein